MTRPGARPGSGRTPRRPPGVSLTPAQLGVLALVLALFIVGLVVGGVVGAILVGVLAIAAGVWLALRWGALPSRVRAVRAIAVVLAIAVAVSLLWR